MNIINDKIKQKMKANPKALVGKLSTWNPLKHVFSLCDISSFEPKEELIDHVIITLDGRMFLIHEKLKYASQINFDPYTGEEAKVRIIPREGK